MTPHKKLASKVKNIKNVLKKEKKKFPAPPIEDASCSQQLNQNAIAIDHIDRMRDFNNVKATKTSKFQPKVPATEYQRFIYKCNDCLLGFKRRG